MSYIVLARKWRPQRFEDIVGQEHVTRTLRNAISAGRIAHAYLFTGVRGVGKTSAARILARCLNCEQGPTADPCNRCAACNEILAGSSIDVYEIDGASNRGIDEVRQIIENVRYQPAKSRFKIYIIDEVHQVTKDAFNALLKTLEEPPSFVKFILATTEPHRLPETILSRCQRFDFRRIPLREIVSRLREIAGKENLQVTDPALVLLAREAEGSMRDAQSLLEQILSYSVPLAGEEKTSVQVDGSLLQEILGIAERKTLYEFSQAVIQGDARRCIEQVGAIVAQGRDIPRLSRELAEHFRNLLVARLVQDAGEQGKDSPGRPSISQLLDLPDEEIEELKAQVKDLPLDLLMDYFSFMADSDLEVARSPYPRFALETALARLASLPKGMPVAEIVERLEALEAKLSKSGSGQPAARSSEKSRPEPKASDRPQDEAVSDANTKETWKKFVAFVTGEKKGLGAHLDQAGVLEIGPRRLTIAAGEKYQLSYLQDPENLTLLKDLARRFFSSDVAVSVTPAGIEKPDDDRRAAEPIKSGDGGSDLVQEALRIFGGSIRETKKGNG